MLVDAPFGAVLLAGTNAEGHVLGKAIASVPMCMLMQVTEGCGRVLVLAVGSNSEWGKTMAMCQSEPGETPLQQQLELMAGGIAKLGLGVAVVCFIVLMLR